MKSLIKRIVSTAAFFLFLFCLFVESDFAGGEEMHSEYNIIKNIAYGNKALGFIIQIPKGWSAQRVTSEDAELSQDKLKPLGAFVAEEGDRGDVTELQIFAIGAPENVQPLKWIQFYLHQLSKTTKVNIDSITTIDNFRAKAALTISSDDHPRMAEIFINISEDRRRIFILNFISIEDKIPECCDYIFRSFSIID